MIVNTDGEYSYVGRLVVEFDSNGNMIADSIDPNVSGAFAADRRNDPGPVRTNDRLDIDGDVKPPTPLRRGSRGDLVDDITTASVGSSPLQDGNLFGKTDVYLEGRRGEVRAQENYLGDLTADANLWYAQEDDGAVFVSIKNGGGIRDLIGRVEATPSHV